MVVEAWRQFGIPHPLTVAGSLLADHAPVLGVTFAGHISDDVLRREQNACMFHLQPSWTEGFGMAIHEALSCGALVSVPNAPPMNEWSGCQERLLVQPAEFKKQRMAVTVRVTPEGVRRAVEACMSMSEDEIARFKAAARRQYDEERAVFESRMLELLGGAVAAVA